MYVKIKKLKYFLITIYFNTLKATNMSLNKRNIWVIRQNNGGHTNQSFMKKFNIDYGTIICPWGIFGESRSCIIDRHYNENNPSWSSGGQDRMFVENINIGDILVIMYSKIKECVIAEVVSDVNFEKSTDLKISELKKEDGKASYIISEDGEFEFRPITRDIRIIRDNVMFTDKRRLGTMKTLVKITNDEHKKNIMDYVDK